MTEREELETSAQAGFQLLEQRDPGWWRSDATPAIDLCTLDINSTGKCVLGQCYGEYWAGMSTLGLECVDADSEPYGFTPPLGEDSDEDKVNSDRLTQAWKDLIIARRAAE